MWIHEIKVAGIHKKHCDLRQFCFVNCKLAVMPSQFSVAGYTRVRRRLAQQGVRPMFTYNIIRTKKALFCLLTVLTLLLVLLLPTLNATVRAAPSYTEVGGPIVSDTTWTLANSPYVVTSSVQVMTGVTLTIQAGVMVKFNTGKVLQTDGTLVARGTAGQPITFTSNNANPANGDWGNIYFADSSVDATFDASGNYLGGSVLQYCIVEYGGSGVQTAIYAPSAAPFIDHCTVRNNAKGGILIAGSAGKPAVVSNNTIINNSAYNGGGIYAGFSTVAYNTVSNNSAIEYGGGIYARNNSTVIGNTVISNTVTGTGYYGTGCGGGISVESSTVNSNTVISNSAKGSQTACGGGISANVSTVSNNTVNNNSASGGSYYSDGGGIYLRDSIASNNTVSNNSATRGGGIYADTYGYNTVISNNTILNNSASNGGGIYAFWIDKVNNNVVSANFARGKGGGIYAIGTTVVTNTITENTVASVGQGAGAYHESYWSSDEFTGNTVVNNSGPLTQIIGGVAINVIWYVPQVHNNNLYGNSPYDVVVVSSKDISGTNNYFGTTNNVNILAQIYDWYDDTARGRFLYIPYLQDPSPDSPVPPPQNLRGIFGNSSTTLMWNPIPSTLTGYGYKVYYATHSGPPYDGTGAVQGNSPINVGNVIAYSLTGLPANVRYFIVTAYDTLGRESWYSNEVNNIPRVYLPLILNNR